MSCASEDRFQIQQIHRYHIEEICWSADDSQECLYKEPPDGNAGNCKLLCTEIKIHRTFTSINLLADQAKGLSPLNDSQISKQGFFQYFFLSCACFKSNRVAVLSKISSPKVLFMISWQDVLLICYIAVS